MSNHFDIIVVGGGISGLATAVALLGGGGRGETPPLPPPRENDSSRGIGTLSLRLAVLERATQLRPVGAALGLFPNGLSALKAISPTVHDKVLASCIPSTVMYVKDAADPQKILQQVGQTPSHQDTTTTTNNNNNNDSSNKQDNGKEVQQQQQPKRRGASSGGESKGAGVGGVHMMVWYLLQQYLADELPRNVIRIGTMVEAVEILQPSSSSSSTGTQNDNDHGKNNNDPAQIKVTTLNRATGEQEILYCHVLIGADGIHSTIRQALWPDSRDNTLLYHNKLMFRAVMECKLIHEKFCPPTGEQVAYQDRHVPGKLFAFRETSPGLLTFTSMANFNHDESKDASSMSFGATAQERKARLEELFCDYPEDVRHILSKCPADALYVNAVYDLEQVVEQWSRRGGGVVLIGDAAHAMTPGMGQGANFGLEDAAELAYFVLKTLNNHRHHHHDENGHGKMTCSPWPSASIMDSTLEEFWKSRMERVKMVHHGSRERTRLNNQACASSSNNTSNKSTDDTTSSDNSNNKVSALYTQNQDIRELVHGWKPSCMNAVERSVKET